MAKQTLRLTIEITFNDEEVSINESYCDDVQDLIQNDLEDYYSDEDFDVSIINSDLFE